MRDIVVFMHMATMGRYREVNAEILAAVKFSGLLRACKKFHISVVGDGDIDLPYESDKFDIKLMDKNPGIFEYKSADRMREYCWENKCHALYMQNCGVSHPKDRQDLYPGWRHLRLHIYIMKWRRCIQALEDGNDCAGLEWLTDPVPHFSGSFYWAKSEYIKTLPTVEDAKQLSLQAVNSHRHGIEFWIGMNKTVKAKSFFNTGEHWMHRREDINWYDEAMDRMDGDGM